MWVKEKPQGKSERVFCIPTHPEQTTRAQITVYFYGRGNISGAPRNLRAEQVATAKTSSLKSFHHDVSYENGCSFTGDVA